MDAGKFWEVLAPMATAFHPAFVMYTDCVWSGKLTEGPIRLELPIAAGRISPAIHTLAWGTAQHPHYSENTKQPHSNPSMKTSGPAGISSTQAFETIGEQPARAGKCRAAEDDRPWPTAFIHEPAATLSRQNDP